jgi:hypothetical protein
VLSVGSASCSAPGIDVVFYINDGYTFSRADQRTIETIATGAALDAKRLLPGLPDQLVVRVNPGKKVMAETGQTGGVPFLSPADTGLRYPCGIVVRKYGQLSSLLSALRDCEQQRTALRQQLDGLAGLAQLSTLDVRRVERDLRAGVKDWRALLGRQTPIARQIVTKLLDEDRFVFTPRADRSWEVTGRASFGKLFQGIVLPQVWRPQRDSVDCGGYREAA